MRAFHSHYSNTADVFIHLSSYSIWDFILTLVSWKQKSLPHVPFDKNAIRVELNFEDSHKQVCHASHSNSY